MSVFARVKMPALEGAIEWLNSEPLGPAELRGHVVLVNFWTLTCINWLRQEPHVRAWSQAYRDDGLVVIGVHTPEFSFEHEVDGIRRAIEERAIDYPVAVDNEYEIWSAFDNHFWPASTSSTRRASFATTTSARAATRSPSASSSVCWASSASSPPSREWVWRPHPTGITCARPRRISATGAAGSSHHPTAPHPKNAAPTSFPGIWASTSGRSPASGRSGARTSCPTRPAGELPSASTRATRISCCLPERERRFPSACASTARLRDCHTAWT